MQYSLYMSNHRIIVMRGVMICVSLLLAVVSVEIGARIWTNSQYHDALVLIPDIALHHRLIPDITRTTVSAEWNRTVSINKLGMRGELPRSNVRTVLLLGDSFVYGWGVSDDETIPVLLEKRLNEIMPDEEFQVLNGGVPSYSPVLSNLQYKTTLRYLNPDIVIYVFDMSDVSDEVRYREFLIKDRYGDPVRVTNPYAMHQALMSILGRSYIYQQLMRLLTRNGYPHELHNEKNDHWIGMRDNTEALAPNGWASVQENLRLLRDYVREDGAEMLLTVVPRSPQVDPEYLNKNDRDHFGFPAASVCCGEMFNVLGGIASELGIRYINPLNFFLENKSRSLFYYYDGHLTNKGNSLMAEYMSHVLFEEIATSE